MTNTPDPLLEADPNHADLELDELTAPTMHTLARLARLAEAELELAELRSGAAPDVHAMALRTILDRWAQPPPGMLALLPRSTRKENAKGRCDVCGGWHGLPAVHLDYMGHADITEALILIDPFWNWRPAAINHDTGGPFVQRRDSTLTMWGYLTVLGVERLCVGTCEASKPEPEKELIGDLLRNGALRFGIAVRLWSKADHVDMADATGPTDTGAPPAPAPVGDPGPAEPAGAPVDTNAGGRETARRARADKARQDVADQAAAARSGSEATLPASSSAAPPRTSPVPRDPGPGVLELAALATSGPLKTRALRAARDACTELAIALPGSYEDVLAGPDYIAAAAAEALEAHLGRKANADTESQPVTLGDGA